MKHAIKVATRVVAFVSLAAVMSGCITERQASRFLRPDANYAPAIYSKSNYAAIGEQLDLLEGAISVSGVNCVTTSVQDSSDPREPEARERRKVEKRRFEEYPSRRLDPANISCTYPKVFKDDKERLAAIDEYVERRNAQIDALCDAYLGSLSSIGDTSRWSRTQVNAVADITSVVMGLAKAPANQLAYLAAGKSLYNQSADNLENYLLLSPSAEKITQLVRTAQAKKREDKSLLRQIEHDGEQWTESSLWVQNYAMLCTPRGIRGLLNEAIDLRAPISEAGARQVAIDLGVRMETLLRELSKNNGINQQSWDALKDPVILGSVAWYIRENGNLTGEEKAFFAAKVGPDLAALLPVLFKEPSSVARLNGELDGAIGRYEELIRMAKMAQTAGSAATRTEAAEKAAKDAKQEAENAAKLAQTAQEQASKAKTENAITQKTITQMQAQLNQTVTQLSETNAALAKTVAERDALQKQLDALKPE